MPTKQEIENAIRQGNERVQRTFGSLSDEELNRVVHTGDGGWTAKEVLAHLAGRAQGYQRSVQAAIGSAAPSLPSGANLAQWVDNWNRERIAERIHQSRDELLREFHEVHDDLIQKMHSLSDDQLATTIKRPNGAEITVGESLALSAGRHSINHTAEVEQALGKEQPAA